MPERKKLNKEKKASEQEPKHSDTHLPITHTHSCSFAIFSTDQKETAIQQRLHGCKFNSMHTLFQRLENPNACTTF